MQMSRITAGLCAFSLTVLAGCGGGGPGKRPPRQPLSIATSSLADAFVNFAYTQTIQASGGVPPFTWTVSSGNLPHGVALGSGSTNSVVISGTPDTAQTAFSFTLRVADAANQTADKSYTININNTASADLQEIQGQGPSGTIEIQGVGAGAFNPAYWQKDTLNWVPDVRIPMLAAQTTGVYQNIYAPWPLQQTNGWRLFYGGWDGQDVPFDQIYSVTTTDFLNFANRDHVIANGEFLNVNNVNVQQLPDGSLHMICTGGQAANSGGDKPLYFSSPDGTTWNGTPEPYSALLTDVISIQGYAPFSSGNFNGANVLFKDNATWVLYFKDWNDFGTTYRATADTLPDFQLQGVALKTNDFVQDVKKFVVSGQSWYLMGLVGADPKQTIFYSLSNDGVTFNPQQVLFRNLSAQDLYIVALGLVIRQGQVLGALYGASAVESLDQNQIFARWLQKKVAITDSSGVEHAPQGGYGPDRQWFQLPSAGPIQATIHVYAEDGVTPVASGVVNVSAGKVYDLVTTASR
jgi:Putative Ig domain